jgi:phospholipase C
MKPAVRSLIPLAVLGSVFAHAQVPGLQNVIVVIQENRTPDNLFQDQNLRNHGADIVDPQRVGGKCGGTSVPLQPRTLADCANPDHSHAPGWNTSYDGGNMDGLCSNKVAYLGNCVAHSPYPCPTNGRNATDCSAYAYVSDTAVQPYWQIAETYGFANYFFQTSQGPSFPAHQFLLSGTSAPDAWQTPLYTTFAGENMDNGKEQDAGCASSSNQTTKLVFPNKTEPESIPPCFDHPTLTDYLDQYHITWRWYSDQKNSIWTAPNAISHICNDDKANDGCGTGTGPSQDWANNVAPYLELAPRMLKGFSPTLAPFLWDLQNCNFPKTGTMGGVYFVVPDGRWSDHPTQTNGLGPDYVANIVNLVGNSTCVSPQPNWSNTVILIVWDDWGGWYDHVSPGGILGPGIGYPNSGNNNGIQYVYGFRVPLLVVSTNLKQFSQTYTGYISGTMNSPIDYDFGSILKFIENNFLPANTSINPPYPYADHFVTLNKNDLSDFFDCPTCQHKFQPITLQYSSQCTAATCGATQCNSNGQCLCDTACFINYKGNAKDPDDE